jgi:2-amino-4,5-dihydroxy-6-oxo-7-(phosphooxy)heptanoate synthase
MHTNSSFARQVRLRRLHRHGDDRLFVVPLDHSVTDGPIVRDSLDRLIGRLADGGVDVVVLHKGSVRRVAAERFAEMSLMVHLSASTAHAADPDAKYLVAGVEEALRIGADAVSVHVNLGSADERSQLADLAAVGDACDRWNVPLLAMVYPRGPRIDNPRDPVLVAHAATIAADLGADLVKTVYVGTVAEMRDVVRSCPIPVITAGGPLLSDEAALLSRVDEVMGSGAAGIAMGRNIFQAADPGATARAVSAVVHGGPGRGKSAGLSRVAVG